MHENRHMTVSRSKRFIFIDKKHEVNKKQIFIFGSIIASSCLSGALFIALYIEYLHNPTFHIFVQSKGIFLWIVRSSDIQKLIWLFIKGKSPRVYESLYELINSRRSKTKEYIVNECRE